MDIYEKSLTLHNELRGKFEIRPRCQIKGPEDLTVVYTPGVAEPCRAIQADPLRSFELTRRGNLVAVITDGTAVLGLGNIGPEAGMPVMEGKCVIFKQFAGVDAVPICIQSSDVNIICETIYQISGSFGAINLEDISAPRCFEVLRRTEESCGIPVFHDDQDGTAIVTAAALSNALKLLGRSLAAQKIVVSGAGAAGIAITRLLLTMGAKDILVCDSCGILCGSEPRLEGAKCEIAAQTNRTNLVGGLKDALKGADVFIGVSAPNLVTEQMVRNMSEEPIVFAMANPVPEIMPEAAKAAGARIVGTGRSDFENQINNALVFPGIFRGALAAKATAINAEMKIAAVHALAGLIRQDELRDDYIIPSIFDDRVVPAISAAVAEAAVVSGVVRN